MLTNCLVNGVEFKVARALSDSARYKASLLISHFGDCVRPIQSTPCEMFVVSIKEDGVFRIVGTCSSGRSNNFSSEIFHLCVHEKYRRLGLARVLLDYVISTSSKPFLFSNVHSSNIASRNLFEQAGFRIFNTYKKVDRNGENAEFTVYYLSREASNNASIQQG